MSTKKEVKNSVKDAVEVEKSVELKEVKLKSEAELKEAKLIKEHKKITKIEFTISKGKVLTAYCRTPTLAELDGTLTTMQSAPISSSVGLFKTICVGGDDELKEYLEDAGFAVAIHSQIQKVIPNYFATSKSL